MLGFTCNGGFVSGFCVEVKESSSIENGRKCFCTMLRMEMLQWMLLTNSAESWTYVTSSICQKLLCGFQMSTSSNLNVGTLKGL